MKTAISIPDETFERADRQAAALGVSRSELYTTAVQRYLDQLEEESMVAGINAAVDMVGGDDSSDAAVVAGHRTLVAVEDEW
ncbi:MAG: ribbon-helix-helix domain-containing protein [Micromonosporaceae bacterium]